MYELLGEYPCKIDSKGRLRLPTEFLNQLPAEERDSFVVNRGFEKCLVLYPKKVWDKESASVNRLNEFDAKSRQFKRLYYRGATNLKRDGADRLNFPNQLLEWAGIDGEVMLNCRHERIEIWPKGSFVDSLEIPNEDYSELAQLLLGNKSNEDERPNSPKPFDL